MSGHSIVEYFAEHEAYSCGYCGSKDTNYSHGMWTHVLTCQDYQDLIDRGWRRSGCYTYKPTLDVTCCPMYPIRCKAEEFKLTKSQKKVIKKVNRFLNTGIRPSKSENEAEGQQVKQVIPGADKQGSKGVTELENPSSQHTPSPMEVGQSSSVQSSSDQSNANRASVQSSSNKSNTDSTDSTLTMQDSNTTGSESQNHTNNQMEHDSGAQNTNSSSCSSLKSKKSPKKGEGADPDKPTCKKAKVRRKEEWLKKHQGEENSEDVIKSKKGFGGNNVKTLSDYLEDVVEHPVHKLQVRLVRSSPASKLFEETSDEAFLVYKKYQMAIHKDEEEKINVKQYTRFLVNSPLKPDKNARIKDGMGSFHQQYLLDGKIIAVGVIDILPHCMSSVYLFYDPAYDFLSLGTYSALREVEFVQGLHRRDPRLQWYYMGYYIHDCPKMRYKGNYYPSYLACPETYEWCPIEEAGAKLDKKKYCRFNNDSDKKDPNADLDLGQVKIMYSRQAMGYDIYRALNPEVDDAQEVAEYGGLVGNTLAKRMLLYRN